MTKDVESRTVARDLLADESLGCRGAGDFVDEISVWIVELGVKSAGIVIAFTRHLVRLGHVERTLVVVVQVVEPRDMGDKLDRLCVLRPLANTDGARCRRKIAQLGFITVAIPRIETSLRRSRSRPFLASATD